MHAGLDIFMDKKLNACSMHIGQVHTLYGKWEIMNWFRYPEIPY